MIVLDTHALFWVLADSPSLGRRAAAMANRALAADRLATSALAFWEASLLAARGRLKLATSPGQFRFNVLDLGIKELTVTGDIAIAAAELAGALTDPADALMAATALVHHGRLMTADRRVLDARVVETINAKR